MYFWINFISQKNKHIVKNDGIYGIYIIAYIHIYIYTYVYVYIYIYIDIYNIYIYIYIYIAADDVWYDGAPMISTQIPLLLDTT